MRANKLFKRPKAENGAGRSVKIKHLLLPEEVVEDLRLYKDIYSVCLAKEKDENGNPIPVRVTFEQMFRRWMDNISRIDPDVQRAFETAKASRMEQPQTFDVNPAEGEIWEMRHFFERDGEQVDAVPGDLAPFYAVINGRRIGMKALLADDWVLMNEAGIEIDYDKAGEVSRILKEHLSAKSATK